MATVDPRLELIKMNQRIQDLEQRLAVATGVSAPPKLLEPEEQPDYIPHGSDRHAALLGLIKGESGSWELDDPLQYAARFGVAATPEFLSILLKQKVNELMRKPSVPDNAPALWIPPDAGQGVRGIV